MPASPPFAQAVIAECAPAKFRSVRGQSAILISLRRLRLRTPSTDVNADPSPWGRIFN